MLLETVSKWHFSRRHHARRSPSTGSTHSTLSVHSPTRSSGASSPVLFNNSTSTNTHGRCIHYKHLCVLILYFLAGMSSPVGQRVQSHHVHRNSSHVGANTHVTVTPPPSTPTHHRANSSGGSTTTSGSSLMSTLTSPESDTASLVTGNLILPKTQNRHRC